MLAEMIDADLFENIGTKNIFISRRRDSYRCNVLTQLANKTSIESTGFQCTGLLK